MSETANRLASLDVLRGFDMLWIMGLSSVVVSFCGLFSGGNEWWVCQQMHHANGVGFTFYDLIFPLFLFMAGASWPFSYASQVRRGVASSVVHLRILKRVFALAVIQMVQSGILWFDPAHYCYPSVLIRIGLSWAIAALVYIHCRPRFRMAVALTIVVAYWAVLTFVQSPLVPSGQALDYSEWSRSHVAWLDQYFSFRAWFGHDPFERMDLTLSVVQVPLALLGMYAGDVVRRPDLTPVRRTIKLAGLGFLLAVMGLAVAFAGCPLHKVLSTPSFMLLAGGLCCCLLSLFYYVVDVRSCTGWAYPLRVIGQNSIVAYLLPPLIGFFPAQPFIDAVGRLVFCWLILWALARAKLHLKV